MISFSLGGSFSQWGCHKPSLLGRKDVGACVQARSLSPEAASAMVVLLTHPFLLIATLFPQRLNHEQLAVSQERECSTSWCQKM